MSAAPQAQVSDTPPRRPSVALLCAGGAMPLIVAEEARRAGREPFLIGIEGLASPDIARYAHGWLKLGQLGRFADLLAEQGLKEVAVVGALARPRLGDLKLDLGALRRLPAIVRMLRAGGDDALLRRLTRLVETEFSIAIVGVHEIAPGLVIGPGPLGRVSADRRAQTEGATGLALLAALSPFDCGQAAVMVDRRPVAIEGVEGTDAMIERVAALRQSGRLRLKGRRGVLVKAPKRGQDMRMDMPTIGPETLRRVQEAGLAGVIVEAGAVLLAGVEETRAAADRYGLFVEGVAAS